jgi:hypothetical protein
VCSASIQAAPSLCSSLPGAARCHTGMFDIYFSQLPCRGFGVKEDSGNTNSSPHLFPLRLLPWSPPCSHSFHSLSFSMRYRLSPSKMGERFVAPFISTNPVPVTRSFEIQKGVNACGNATFAWVDDNPHERPPFHVQILCTSSQCDHQDI